MKTSTAANRYAKSLLTLALEKGVLERVKTDMEYINSCYTESHDLQVMLKSPIIKSAKKGNVLNVLFSAQLSELSLKFIQLLTSNSRESLLGQIAFEFANQYNDYKGVVTAIVTSANGLDDLLRKKVLETIKGSLNKEVALIEQVDPKLIGGFIIKIGDTQIDSSVAKSLKDLKKQFSAN